MTKQWLRFSWRKMRNKPTWNLSRLPRSQWEASGWRRRRQLTGRWPGRGTPTGDPPSAPSPPPRPHEYQNSSGQTTKKSRWKKFDCRMWTKPKCCLRRKWRKQPMKGARPTKSREPNRTNWASPPPPPTASFPADDSDHLRSAAARPRARRSCRADCWGTGVFPGTLVWGKYCKRLNQLLSPKCD